MLRLAFDFIITWRETRTRPNAYLLIVSETTCAFENKVKNIPSVPETYLIRINYNHLML